jgi:hypothetical protein
MLAARVALAFTSALLFTAAPLRAQQPQTADTALVELHIAGGPTTVLHAAVRDSTLLLPLGPVFDVAEVRQDTVVPGCRWEGTLEPDHLRLAVSTEGRFLRRGERAWALSATDASWDGRELFVTVAVLQRLLDVTMDINWTELVVLMRHTDALPAVRRQERERRRSRLLAEASQSATAVPLEAPTPLVDGAVLDWAAASDLRQPLGTAGFDLGVGADIAAGGLRIAHSERHTSIGRYALTRASWVRAWPQGRWLRQLRLGDVSTTGPQPFEQLGVALTNAPYLRPATFGVMTLDGSAPAGWDIDVYRDHALLASQQIDPLGTFAVPVVAHYGSNPLTVTAYGPHGEIIQDRRAFLVTEDRLPNGHFEYGVSAGTCTALPCHFQLNADSRFALGETTTLRAGVTYLSRDSITRRVYPYATLSAAPRLSLSLGLNLVPGVLAAANLRFVPSPDLSVMLGHTAFTTDQPDPVFGVGSLRHQTDADVFWRPARRDGASFLRGRFLSQASAGTGRSYLTITATQPLSEARFIGVSVAGALLLQRFGEPLRNVFVRASLSAAFDSAFTGLGISVARQFSHALRIEIAPQWHRRVGFQLSLSISTALSGMRAVQSAAYDRQLGMQGLQTLEGSVLWDARDRQLTLADGRSLDRAGVSGVIYYDENGNGVRDPGEAGVQGARVQIGPQAAWTDSSGHFASWDLMPFEPADVQIDSLSLSSPLWMPSATHYTVLPAPNTYRRIELPLVPVGEASGTITHAGRPVRGVRVRLVPVRGATFETTTFEDGGFYVLGIRPGRYRVLVGDQPDAVAVIEFDPTQGAHAVPPIRIVLP